MRAAAERIGATTGQVAIAWVLRQGRDIVPLIGARRRDRLEESLGALDTEIDPDEIEAAIPAGSAAGARYSPPQMATLDSER
ncbi:aldo/keto reductase [Actinoplanes solisilvae]|uniref:aldo/keto reductase n=1 Tax=Actinoplanes solisilvae TaxID=2486853 RepID=UPI001F0CB1A9|nr:aldo/keto reductase [Actinoplanes solisilvae]